MSFDVQIARRLGTARVAVTIATGAGAQSTAALVGPSGAGKTSILNMIAGLIRPASGHIRVGGTTLFDRAARIDLSPERRHAGYVFQEPRLFPHLTVRANLAYGQRRRGPAASIVEAIDGTTGWLAPLGIGRLLDRSPATLSGGEARRVAIGRALLSEPDFLLLDEPLSSLDPARAEEVLRMIEQIRDARRLPILMVTHRREEADRIAGTVILLAPLTDHPDR